MSAIRTQIYLTAEQRKQIDELARRDGATMADVVRRALDSYLRDAGADADKALEKTFGGDLEIVPPNRDDWARG